MSRVPRVKPALLCVLLVLAGAARIVSTYRQIAQTSDETPNIACGMQYLDLGRYDYGAFHPPLARLAIALGPYLYGARSQHRPDRWQEGNAVLDSTPRPAKALALARLGILPFFLLAAAVVWLWGRRLLGEWGALAAVFLFTNTPAVLAHAGLATMDMAVGAGVCAALYTFTRWLEEPTLKRSVWFGAGLAIALLTKFSSLLLLPVCGAALAMLYRPKWRGRNWAWIAVAFVLVWAAYRFSFGPMTEHVARDAAGQGGIWARIPPGLLHLVESTPVPAPAILDGMWQVHNHIEGGHTAYLLGRHSFHGWWYFFPVALAVKTPLGLLALALVGAFSRKVRAPAAVCAAMVLVNLPTSLNIGVRYMLPLFPVLALVAAGGVVWLWERQRILAAALMLWIAVSAALAHPDYIAYFNELGGSHPERILVDSDLDWGQDMHRLAAELKRRNVAYLHMACMYTGDDARLGLPGWDSLEPYQPVKGWVAVSYTMRENYAWMAARQQGRGDLAFAWLDRYRPVGRVGKSIELYYIE